MKSITTVFKVGNGPSSSHTVGPFGAARYFKQLFPGAAYKVTLFGSLALTGVGHGTKKAICTVLPEAEICFDTETHDIPHPNTMLFEAFDKNGNEIGRRRIFSIGGGSIRIEGENNGDEDEVYSEKNFTEIMKVCEHEDIDLVEYVLRH